MTREERKGRRGRVANSCVSVVCVLVGACTVSLDLWWQVSSVISVLKLDVFDFWNVKPEHKTFLWGTWGETTEVNWPSNLSEFKSKKDIREQEEGLGEQVRGWRRRWMEGRKTKKRDSYYRAGCRGRLFSPSSLCGRKTTIGGLGESQS